MLLVRRFTKMRQLTYMALLLSLGFSVPIAVSHNAFKSFGIQNSVEEQRRFLSTVVERIKQKCAEEEMRSRSEQDKNEQAEQEASRALEQAVSERQKAERAALEATEIEVSSERDLVNDRTNPLFKTALELKRERQEAEKQLRVVLDKENQLIVIVETYSARLIEQEKVLEIIQKRIEEIAIIERQVQNWNNNPTPTGYAEISQELENIARAQRIRSSVYSNL